MTDTLSRAVERPDIEDIRANCVGALEHPTTARVTGVLKYDVPALLASVASLEAEVNRLGGFDYVPKAFGVLDQCSRLISALRKHHEWRLVERKVFVRNVIGDLIPLPWSTDYSKGDLFKETVAALDHKEEDRHG